MRHYSTTADGDRACAEYRLVREEHLIRAFFSDPGVAAESAQATRFLSRIIANYLAGITDEAELLALSRQPLGR